MINGFLQFLKKQKLAIRLAEEDLLFLLEPLHTFQATLPVARWFVRHSSVSPQIRIETFLSRSGNSLPPSFAVKIALNYEKQPPCYPVRHLSESVSLKQPLSATKRNEYRFLLTELVEKDWPMLSLDDLFQTLDWNLDMRLWAAELEHLGHEAAEYQGFLKFDIDWLNTTQQQLSFLPPEPLTYASELSEKAQSNLSEIFFRLFFKKKLLIYDWPAVICNAEGQISWLDFSCEEYSDEKLQRFAWDYLHEHRFPQTPEEHHVKRALNLLKIYCPKIDLSILAEEINSVLLPEYKITDKKWEEQTLSDLKRLGVNSEINKNYEETDPQSVLYLLDSKRHPKASGHQKVSFYYWGPLILAAGILYYFF